MLSPMGRSRSRTSLPLLVLPAALLSVAGCVPLRPVRVNYEKHTSEEHNDFGVVYEGAGNLREAEVQYRRAIKKDPNNHVAYTNLGNVLAKCGKDGQAETSYRRALAIKPGYGVAANNLANLMMTRGRAQAAVDLVAGALPNADASEIPFLHATLGEAHLKLDRKELAATHLQKAVETSSDETFRQRYRKLREETIAGPSSEEGGTHER